MNARSLTADLLKHLGQVAAILWVMTGSLSSPSAFPLPYAADPPTWTVSTAVTMGAESRWTMGKVAELALREIDKSCSLLGVQELRAELEFPVYTAAVEACLAAFDSGSKDQNSMFALAASLEVARVSLAQQVGVLASWLAIVRTISPGSSRYGAIPARFVAPASEVIAYERPPTAEEIAQTFEFDSLQAV